MTIPDHTFQVPLKVRDYECDMQGIANNAQYLHYLEHTRHEFLKSKGYDFAEITQQGTHLVITRAEIDYLHPLKSGQHFLVTLNISTKSRLKVLFHQAIFNRDTSTCMLTAQFTTVALNRAGKPFVSEILKALVL